MSILAPTPSARMTDASGRPYFLWDDDMSLETFQGMLRDPDPEVRSYFLGKLMRQAKPDDVFTFVSRQQTKEDWVRLERYLGNTHAFWQWLLSRWSHSAHVNR